MGDYFYGEQADQFTFFRVPKVLFTDPEYKEMPAEAKILYGILLDRMSLSMKNRWVDDRNRVYIIYTIDEIMDALGCAEHKAVKLLTVLEKKGLAERRRRGLGKPNLIYVKNFIHGRREAQDLNCENGGCRIAENAIPELPAAQGNKTDYSHTDYSDTDSLLSKGMKNGPECVDYEQYFREHLAIDALVNDYPDDEKIILGILDLLVDVCSTEKQTIRIVGENKPARAVRGRMMRLGMGHIVYVISAMKQNSTFVVNMKQYLLAALYNAPAVMDLHYMSRVNYDQTLGSE